MIYYMSSDDVAWKILETYFNDNPNFAPAHHLNSYNRFFKDGLVKIFSENNPIYFFKETLPDGSSQYTRDVYMGGREGRLIYYGKPIIYDDDRTHYMYPNEARLRNLTYGFTIHYDVLLDMNYREYDPETDTYIDHKKEVILEKIYLGRFPIMLQSDLCILKGLAPEVRFNMGECRNDMGGYFIIAGKEKVIVSQEKFADNTLYIREYKEGELYSHSAEIRTVSEDMSKPQRTLSVRIKAPSETLTNEQIVVNVPNVRVPVPLFILMRALGVESDREIIECCLLDMEANQSYLELFRPSVHDASTVFDQAAAIRFIATFTKGKTVDTVLQILRDYLLPHLGELNFKNKAMYLGYIVKRLLDVYTGLHQPTDRDNYMYKRIEDSGTIIRDLFLEYYKLQLKNIYLMMDHKYHYKAENSQRVEDVNRESMSRLASSAPGSKVKIIFQLYQGKDFFELIPKNRHEIFESSHIVDDGFKKAFRGNWGATPHTKRIGVLQDLNRLSYFAFLSHLRKLNLPMDSSVKLVKPRLCHSTQWGVICPIHTPTAAT